MKPFRGPLLHAHAQINCGVPARGVRAPHTLLHSTRAHAITDRVKRGRSGFRGYIQIAYQTCYALFPLLPPPSPAWPAHFMHAEYIRIYRIAHIIILFRGSIISRISRIWNRSRNLFN